VTTPSFAALVLTCMSYLFRSFQLDSRDGDPITNTVKQMYAADNTLGLNVSFTHAMYNDDPPNASTASAGFAHSKGFLAANETNGFWVTHSVPNWPYALTTGFLPFPTASQGIYAQSFICISMNSSTANLIGISLLKMRPKYYSQSLPPALLPLFPDINAALISTGVITTVPFAISVSLYSAGIGSPPRLFTSFAKSTRFGRDVWNVATPALPHSLAISSYSRSPLLFPVSGLHRTIPQHLTVHGGIPLPSPSTTPNLFHPSPCMTRTQGWVNGVNRNGSTLNSSCNIFPQTYSPVLLHNCISFLLTQLIAHRSTMRVSSVTFNSFSPAPIGPQLWTSTKDHRCIPKVIAKPPSSAHHPLAPANGLYQRAQSSPPSASAT
jgi:hypothetical protein